MTDQTPAYPPLSAPVDPLVVAKHEARQWRESASHHKQIADHYRNALIAVIDGRMYGVAEMTDALENPPKWDGVLLSGEKPDRSQERAALTALYHSIPDHTDFPSALWGAATVLMLLRDEPISDAPTDGAS